jgi:phenylpyruvate tautomerase PptA (4-oxalocrotonate tautomerase family)
MPYLQLDVSQSYSLEAKRRLAKQLGEIYALKMQADVSRVSVAIRELTPGGLWRCTSGEPYEAALLMCDIRKGRPPEQRAELAKALIDACIDTLGLRIEQINVEFTQHTGDEMYHPMRGGLSADWRSDEVDETSSRAEA